MSAAESSAAGAIDALVVSLRYPPYVVGGYELRTRDVVEALRERGHRITVLCGRGADLDAGPDLLPWLEPALDGEGASFAHSFSAGNLERFRLHFFRSANLRATRRALRESGASVLYYFNLSLASIAPLVAARVEGVPALGDISDPWPENHWIKAWREREAGTKSRRLAVLERVWAGFRGIAGLGAALVPSHFMRDRFVRDGLDGEHLEVLPTALDRSYTTEAMARKPIAARAAGEPLRVVSAGALWEGKGVHVVLDAVERCLRRGLAMELVVVGDAPDGAPPDYLDRLIGQASCPPLKDHVQFTGALSRDAVREEFGRAHVFAFASMWGEPYARVPLEAMACGLCVVAADSGANSEQIQSGVDGLLVEPGDGQALAQSFERLAADEMLRKRLAVTGRNRVMETCNFDRYVDGIEDALWRQLGRRRGA